jgi:hypothetical protein
MTTGLPHLDVANVGFLFPSNVVESALGVAATTRWWETLQRIALLLEA